MKKLTLLLLVLGFLLAGCPIDPPPVDDDDSADDDDDDSSGDDDDSSDDDDSADDDDDSSDDDDSAGDDDDSSAAGLEVSDETAGCGPQPDPYPAEGLILNVGGPGAILVLEFDHSVGCCPELDVSPELDFAAATLTVTYTLSNDMCDCICDIDLGYTISGIPAGNWTLVLPNGVNRAFTVL